LSHMDLVNEPRPAGMVACAEPCAFVTVEIFVEKDRVTPVRLALRGWRPRGTHAVLFSASYLSSSNWASTFPAWMARFSAAWSFSFWSA